jgi:hypothetical protein
MPKPKLLKFLSFSSHSPHIVKLMILLTDPLWTSLLLLSSARAKSLDIVPLLLPADKPVWIYPPTADLLFWKILRNEKSRP